MKQEGLTARQRATFKAVARGLTRGDLPDAMVAEIGEPAQFFAHLDVAGRAEFPPLKVARRVKMRPIEYWNHSPRGWGFPLAVLEAKVPGNAAHLHAHLGEELLFNEGPDPIVYHFYWKRPGADNSGEFDRYRVVPAGGFIRFNSALPHENWKAKPGSENDRNPGPDPDLNQTSTAWMFVRPESDNPTSYARPEERDEEQRNTGQTATPKGDKDGRKDLPARREIDGEELKGEKGEIYYALTALGLSEMLAIARSRAELSFKQVADALAASRSLISRIEEQQINNIGFRHLEDLSRLLNVDPSRLLLNHGFDGQVEQVPTGFENGSPQPILQPPVVALAGAGVWEVPHYLHPVVWNLDKRSTASRNDARWFGHDASHSLLGVDGLALVHVDSNGNDAGDTRLLKKGEVLHIRGNHNFTIEGIDKTQIIEIIYSSVCACGKAGASLERREDAK